jgi:hypothetical protein
MTEEDRQLEAMAQCDFDQLARKLGTDILKGLAKNYPYLFANWIADLRFGSAARFVMSFEARLQPVDEAKADLILAADTISDEEH